MKILEEKLDTLILFFLASISLLKRAYQYFPVKGHWLLECDRKIESAKGKICKTGRIYISDDRMELKKIAKKIFLVSK